MESFFRKIPDTTVFVGVPLESDEEINIGVGENGGVLNLKTQEILRGTKEGCFNCLFRGDFNLRQDNQLIVSCRKGYSDNRVDFKCASYKRDKGGKDKIQDLKLNLSS